LCHQDRLITSDKQSRPGPLIPCLAIHVSKDITIHEKWKFHYNPTVKYTPDNRITDLSNKPQPQGNKYSTKMSKQITYNMHIYLQSCRICESQFYKLIAHLNFLKYQINI
jgi:hypothetical protein